METIFFGNTKKFPKKSGIRELNSVLTWPQTKSLTPSYTRKTGKLVGTLLVFNAYKPV